MEEAKEGTPITPLQKVLGYLKKTQLSEIEFILFGKSEFLCSCFFMYDFFHLQALR